MSHATCELIWLWSLRQKLHLFQKESMKLYHDNKVVVYISNNHVFHERTKYIEADCHFISEKVKSKEIIIPFVRSQDQLANIFTNPLARYILFHVFQSWFV